MRRAGFQLEAAAVPEDQHDLTPCAAGFQALTDQDVLSRLHGTAPRKQHDAAVHEVDAGEHGVLTEEPKAAEQRDEEHGSGGRQEHPDLLRDAGLPEALPEQQFLVRQHEHPARGFGVLLQDRSQLLRLFGAQLAVEIAEDQDVELVVLHGAILFWTQALNAARARASAMPTPDRPMPDLSDNRFRLRLRP